MIVACVYSFVIGFVIGAAFADFARWYRDRGHWKKRGQP